MNALGRGSIASIVRIGLIIAWYALWLAGACILAAAAIWGLTRAGVLSPSFLGELNPVGLSWTVVISAFVIGIVTIGGGLIIVWRLRKLFDSFTSGEPFRRENANHLRVIWITMLVVELARYALIAGTQGLFAAFGDSGVGEVKLSIDVSNWMSILILIVLAEVFREGARLKEEQELTI